jgi:ribosomal protein L11 methyltransferase
VKNGPLWEISVITAPEAEEAVVELLERVFKSAAAVYKNEETGITKISVYYQPKAETLRGWKTLLAGNGRRSAPSLPMGWAVLDWGRGGTRPYRVALADGLKAIRDNGLNIGKGRIKVEKVKREDWAESWKKHFQPIEIGAQLLIKPSWIKRKPLKNQAVVVLDPGLSFGTGNHPTTAFCLRELAKGRKPGMAQSFWDIGTGSGILAIAAAKLGYSPVRAMDFDPEAVRVARENARKNGVLEEVQITRADITKLAPTSVKKYDFICANLISNLLIAERLRIVNRLRAGGRLVVAGILREEFVEVQRAYEELGLELTRCRVEREWRSGAFQFKRQN